MITSRMVLDFRGSVPLIMTCVYWAGRRRSRRGRVGPTLRPCAPDLRARRNSPAALIPPRNQQTSYGGIRHPVAIFAHITTGSRIPPLSPPGDLVCHLIAADPAPRAKVALKNFTK